MLGIKRNNIENGDTSIIMFLYKSMVRLPSGILCTVFVAVPQKKYTVGLEKVQIRGPEMIKELELFPYEETLWHLWLFGPEGKQMRLDMIEESKIGVDKVDTAMLFSPS